MLGRVRDAGLYGHQLLFYGFWGVLVAVFLVCFHSIFFQKSESSKNILRIYSWAYYVPDSVLRAFEKQEGVRVVYDVFDSTETLEAKLLAARSGYDVVFASSFPTAALFVPAGVFAPLDMRQLSNRRYLDPEIMARLRGVDRTGQFLLPYLWGTTGLIYHKDKLRDIEEKNPGITFPRDSWQLLFNADYAQKLTQCHMVILDSPADVFPDILLSLGLHPNTLNLNYLKVSALVLAAIKPFIYRFSSDVLQELLAQNICVGQVFSTYANMAIRGLKERYGASPYAYVLPKEGAQLWVDVVAIPKDAGNKKLAHRFLNYLMSPSVIAAVTNQAYAANAVPASKKWVRKDIRDDETIYPSPSTRRRLYTDRLPSRAFQRLRLRYWTSIKGGVLKTDG